MVGYVTIKTTTSSTEKHPEGVELTSTMFSRVHGDEPTGALDYQTGKAILKLLQDTGRKTGMTVVIITHTSALTAMADRVIQVKNGTVTSVEINETPMNIAEIEW